MQTGARRYLQTPEELIRWDVVEEHLDMATFQLASFQRGLDSPVFDLDQIDEGYVYNLMANISGLVVGGPVVAERLLYPELEDMRDVVRTTLSALVLLRSMDRNQWYEVLDFVTVAEGEHRRAIINAIVLFDEPRFEPVLRGAFSDAGSPLEKAALLDVFAALHLDPGELLHNSLNRGFPELDVAAIKAAGHAGRRDITSSIEEHLNSETHELRAAATEAALYLGLRAAWDRCRQQASGDGEEADRALLLVALLGSRSDHKIIYEQLDREPARQAALWAAGFTGNIEAVDRCLPHLRSQTSRTAKLAAEAIAAVTGFDRSTDRELRRHEPERSDEPVSLEADDLDGNLVPDGTDDLPLFDCNAVTIWWGRNRDRFIPGERYLRGLPHTSQELVTALRFGTMRRRHALALELALRTGGQRRVTTRAFTSCQFRELKELSDLREEELVNRFA